MLTETVFAWPGIGLYLTNSLQNADMNAVLGATLVIGTVFVGTERALRPALPPARSEDALSMAINSRQVSPPPLTPPHEGEENNCSGNTPAYQRSIYRLPPPPCGEGLGG